MAHMGNKIALANLRPPWTRETRPNPITRSAAASIRQAVNALSAKNPTIDQLKKLSRRGRWRWRLAARRMLAAVRQGTEQPSAVIDQLLRFEQADRLDRGEPNSISAQSIRLSGAVTVVSASLDAAISRLRSASVPESSWPPRLTEYLRRLPQPPAGAIGVLEVTLPLPYAPR